MRGSAMAVVLLVVVLGWSAGAWAEIEVPPGFVVDTLLNQIDGTTPRLEAIRNPEYGFGVVAASADNGILKVVRISASSFELLGALPGLPTDTQVYTIRFDHTGLFTNELYVSIAYDTGGYPSLDHTEILHVSAQGVFATVASLGSGQDPLCMRFDFSTGAGGYLAGAYLEDRHASNGTSLYHMDTDFTVALLSQDLLPLGRTDLDVAGMEFDPTGVYASYLTMADSDPDHDDMAVIYQLLPDLSWIELASPVTTAVRYYRDMAFSPDGSFGEVLYVTDYVSDAIMAVGTNGVHSVFASGFYGVESITVSGDGEHMFVSDASGVHRIRTVTTEIGPALVMREPWVAGDDVHTGSSGVGSVRLLWSERVLFDNSDLSVTNGDAEPVPFSVSGSNSCFMIIAFGEVLLNDEYAITISDSVISAETGAAIDGDNDGLAGGDAVLIMEHRNTCDSDQDGDADLKDYAAFQAAFTGPLP